MNNIQNEWIAVLERQDFPGWEIKADEKDILILVPDEQDLLLIHKNIPETILNLKPEVTAYEARMSFVVGNSKTSFGYILNLDQDDLEARM